MLVQALVHRHGIDLALGEDERAIASDVLAKQLDLEALLPAKPGELLLPVADVLSNGQTVLVPVVGNLSLLPR